MAATHEAVILFARIHWSIPDLVRDILADWYVSLSAFAQRAYGELVTLIRLMQPELDWPKEYMNNILASEPSSPTRVGAAFAAVNVWAETGDKVAPQLICDLSKNASDGTWSAIIDLFRLVDEITPDPEWVLVLVAIADEIPRHGHFMSAFVIQRLQTLLPHEAGLVASISKALVNRWKADLGDVRTSHASIAPELVDIAVTLHRLGPRTREAGLEIFEQLLAINAYTAREALDQVDNRFRLAQPTRRRRLPRRATKRPRRVRPRGV